MNLVSINYDQLKSRQKENYNFRKIAAILLLSCTNFGGAYNRNPFVDHPEYAKEIYGLKYGGPIVGIDEKVE